MKKILMVVLFVSLLLVLTSSVASAKATVEHVVWDIDDATCNMVAGIEFCTTFRFKGTGHITYMPQPNKPGYWRYNTVTNMRYNHYEATIDGVLVGSDNSDKWHSHSNYDQVYCEEGLGCSLSSSEFAEGIVKQMGKYESITVSPNPEYPWIMYCIAQYNFLQRVVGNTTEIVFDHGTSAMTCEDISE